MSSSLWHRWLKPNTQRSPHRTRRGVSKTTAPGARRRGFLQLELLETRLAPAVKTLSVGGVGLEFMADTFTSSTLANGTTQVSANTKVQVGTIPAAPASFTPLITLDGGVQFIDNNLTGTFTTSGTVTAIVGGQSIPLLDNSTHTFKVPDLLGSSGASATGGKSITVAGVQFTLTNVELDASSISLQGSIAIPKLAGLTFDVSGSNHVVIKSTGVTLTGVTATIPSVSFMAAGVTFAAQNLSATYAAASATNGNHNIFTVSGAASFSLQGNTVNVQMGDPTLKTQGIVLQDGNLQSFDMAVTSSITVAGLSFGTDSLRVAYSVSANSETFAITGGAHFSLSSNSLSVSFGGGSTRGLRIQNGQLRSLDMTVAADFHLLGMGIVAKDLTVSYVPNPEMFTMYGSLTVSAGVLKSITAKLGDATMPGIAIVNGSLTSLNIGLNGSFNLFGLIIAPENLTVQYVAAQNLLQISGGVSVQVTNQIRGEVILGVGADGKPNGGLTIDTKTGAVKISNLEFKLDFTLGIFQVHDLDVKYTTDSNGVISLAAKGFVKFPPGFDVGGSLAFKAGKLTEIGLSLDVPPGIVLLGNTGLSVTHVDGTIGNLDDVSHLIVAGNIGVTYGDAIMIGTTSYSVLTAQGGFQVSADELDLTAAIQVISAKDANGIYHGYYGEGTATVSLNWKTGVYTAALIKVQVYAGIIEFNASVTLTRGGDLTARGDAKLKVPDYIPIIGGHSFAEADFYFQLRPELPPSSSYAAAWVSLDYLIGHVAAGIKIDITSPLQVTYLDQDGINAVGQLTPDPTGKQTYSQQFTVPNNVTFATFTVATPDFGTNPNVAYMLSVDLPPNTISTTQNIVSFAFNNPPTFNSPSTSNALVVDPLPHLIMAFNVVAINPFPLPVIGKTSSRVLSVGDPSGKRLLTPGIYIVKLTTPAPLTTQPMFSASYKYVPPTIMITRISTSNNSSAAVIHLAATSYKSTLAADGSYSPDTPEISLYYTDDPNKAGTLIQDRITNPATAPPNKLSPPILVKPNYYSLSVDVTWNNFADLAPQPYTSRPLYVYAVINDGQNPTLFSNPINPVSPPDPRPEISGPTAQMLNGQAAVTFSKTNGNAITLYDTFALGNGPPVQGVPGDATVTVTLSVQHGTLKVPGGNAAQRSVVFQQTPNKMTAELDVIDNLLDGLQYTPDAAYLGFDTLTVAAHTPINNKDYFTTYSIALFRPNADLAVTQAVDNPTALEGDTVHLTVTASNVLHPGELAATNVTITEMLPAGLTLGAFTMSAGNYDPATGIWTVGTLAAGSAATLSLTASVNKNTGGQLLTSSARGSADQFDAFPDNNASILNLTSQSTSTTKLGSSATAIKYGQSVTLTASVNVGNPADGAPTGTVTFVDNGTVFATVAVSNGTATLTTSTLAAGGHSLVANYNGDDTFRPSSAAPAPLAVTQGQTSTTVVATSSTGSKNSSIFGQFVGFRITVTPVSPATSAPTGAVSLQDVVTTTFMGRPLKVTTVLSSSIPLVNGVGFFSITNISAGTHSITATYLGDNNYLTSTSTPNPWPVQQAQTQTSLTGAGSLTAGGQGVILTANVTVVDPGQGPAAGTVTFLDGNMPLGSAAVTDGTAVLSLDTLFPGHHPLVAVYSGDSNYVGSNASTDLLVHQGPSQDFVAQLYRDLLQREADASGFAFWNSQLGAGLSRRQVVKSFWESPEHRGQQVDQLYATYLHRVADAGGRAFWVQNLVAGVDESNVALGFLTSAEYQAAHSNADAFVTGLYADVLGRAPDQTGASHWQQALQLGASRPQVSQAFLASREKDLQIVDRLYATALGRSADLPGEELYVALLQNRLATVSQVSEAFFSSEEYFGRQSA